MKKVALILICFIWMGFIFYNSSNSGNVSNKRSYSILNNLKNIKNKILENKVESKSQSSKIKIFNKSSIETKFKKVFEIPDNRQERLNFIVRKCAHMFEYFILAILVSILLFTFKLKGKQAIVYIMFICLFYAVTDEFHQQFIAGRTSLVSDSLIDFTGSLIGMFLFYLLYYKILNKHKA
ncbi:VanZ family protein [Clostridium sp. cel8]|nr:VanZ family protein [Clostridium sp. cel8]